MKHLANYITAARLIAASALLLTEPLSAWFYGLFVFCGISDMADGFVARRTGTASRTGAALDSVADAVFVAVSLYKLLPVIELPLPLCLWVGMIAAVKLLNIITGVLRRHRLLTPHAIANKVTGFILFLLPLTLGFVDIRYSAIPACAAASFAAVQEEYYILTGKY